MNLTPQQLFRSGLRVAMTAGSSVTFVLPSGKEINIEVTQDTAQVVQGDGYVLFDEEMNHGVWEQTGPESLVKYLAEKK